MDSMAGGAHSGAMADVVTPSTGHSPPSPSSRPSGQAPCHYKLVCLTVTTVSIKGPPLPCGLCGPRAGQGGAGAACTCNTAFSLSPVRLHDSISEEGFHYLVFDL